MRVADVARYRRLVLLAVGIAAGTAGVRAQSSVDVQAAEAFRQRLLAAVASGDRSRVAALFAFPMRVTATLPYPIPVDTRAEFLRMYPLFFTAEMRCAVEESRFPRAGAPATPWASSVTGKTASFANGRIVATAGPSGLRVTHLTVLGGPEGSSGRTTKVGFRWGLGETQYAGRLALDNRDRYVVSARKGDLLQVRIERFPGRTLQLQVTHRQTKERVRGAATEFARTWGARLPADGDYDVEVVRRAPYCDPAIEYLLSVALRR